MVAQIHLFHQHQVSSQDNDIEDYGISEITQSTSETKPSKSDPSNFRKQTQLTKVVSFHQLMPRTWQIVTTEVIDGVAEDKISTITQSTSKNSIPKSEMACLQNLTQMIKVASLRLNISNSKTSRLLNPIHIIKLASCC